jgi:RNase P subunit RPR2
MSELPKPTWSLHRTTHRRCLVCRSPMEVQRIVEARAGFEHWTLRCTKCGHIGQVQMSTDPLKSDASGWTTGELRPPD